MTDRELLEAAAKAAGYRVRWVDAPTSFNYEGFLIKTGKKLPNGLDAEIRWNPLTDDGDALRLAVKLAMCVDFMDGRVIAGVMSEVVIDFEDEDYRRAIVRAAAEIGRSMKCLT